MLDSIGIIAACMSSVGPAFGIVGPTATYADVSTFGRLVAVSYTHLDVYKRQEHRVVAEKRPKRLFTINTGAC